MFAGDFGRDFKSLYWLADDLVILRILGLTSGATFMSQPVPVAVILVLNFLPPINSP